MRIQIFCFSLLFIAAGIVYAAEVPIKEPKASPEDFSLLADQPDNVLANIASNLSEPDLIRFGRVSRRFHTIAQAESETRASYLWKNGDIISNNFHAHNGSVKAVFVTNDDTIVSVGQSDRHIYVWQWDGAAYQKAKEIIDGVASDIWRASFSSASNRLVLLHLNQLITIWDIQTGNILNQFNMGHDSFLAASPDGARLAISKPNQDGIIILLDAIKGTEIKQINTGFDTIWTIAFSPDGKKLAASALSDGFAKKVWDLTTYKESTFPFTKGHAQLSFLPNGELIATNRTQPLLFWDVQTGKQISAWKWPGTVLGNIELAHNGSILAANHGKKIDIYHFQAGKVLRELDSTNFVRSLAFSSDDKMLVAGCINGDIVTWKVQKKKAKSTK